MAEKDKTTLKPSNSQTNDFAHKRFPFWACLKIGGNHPTLVIDEEKVLDKQCNQLTGGYVHREVTHTKNRITEEITPNPDPTDRRPMYLKSPEKHPETLFKPLNHKWKIPEAFKSRYDKNNRKKHGEGDSK